MEFEDDNGAVTEALFIQADMFPTIGQITGRNYGTTSTHRILAAYSIPRPLL